MDLRPLYRKDNDFLLADLGQIPPVGYLPAQGLPPAVDAARYTYHWLRGDGLHKSTRYELLWASAPFYSVRAPGRRRQSTRKPRDKERQRLRGQLYRARSRLYWCEKDLYPQRDRIKTLRRKIRKLEKLLTRPQK